MNRPWLSFYEEGVPHRLDIPRFTLPAILDHSADQFPENPAIIFRDRSLTYREIRARSDAVAAGMAEIGARKGERVAIMLPNCPQYIESLYGILKIGGIAVNVNPMYVERELEYQLTDAGVETIFALRDFFPRLQAVQKRTSLKNIILTDIDDAFTPRIGLALKNDLGAFEYAGLSQKGSRLPLPIVSSDPEEVAVLQYTGGTTGVSKGAMLTHRNLIANVLQSVTWDRHAQKGRERMLTVLPFFHTYGITSAINASIYQAATIILLSRFEVNEVLEAIDRYQPTRMAGVPTMYIAMANHPRIRACRISSIKVFSCGSAPFPMEAFRNFEELTGGKISEGYGLTETSPLAIANPPFGKQKIGSIGIPRPDTDARIVDLETGEKTLPPGMEGELCIRGPQVMKGYWNRPEETAQALRNGWLYTGDIARMDEDGYFFIVDRKKDMILCSGYNVYPREIEEVLYQHPKIQEACVLGVPDPYRGETVKAFVVLKEGSESSPEEIIAYCRQNMARYKAPTIVEFRKELPRSNVGKILRKVLREEEARQSKS
jgi:long-chain acyl-CoA synthetase